MTAAVVWLDPARGEELVGWGAPVIDAAWLAIAGPQAGPSAARWLAARPADALIVCSRGSAAAELRQFCAVVSAALPRLPIARRVVHTTGLGALVAAQVAQGAHTDPWAVAATMDVVIPQLSAGVWLRRVARLADPRPRFTQHLRSFFPGEGFYAVLGEPGAVLDTKAVGGFGALTRGALVVAGGDDAKAEGLKAAMGDVHQIHHVEPVENLRKAYGSDGFEFVAVPHHRSLALRAPHGHCPVCRHPSSAEVCPFCHVHTISEVAA